MEYRRLGASGLRVPALSFGTGTFGGGNDFFKAWGSTDAGVPPIPEPATWAMMLLGFGAAGFALRRRRRPALRQIA